MPNPNEIHSQQPSAVPAALLGMIGTAQQINLAGEIAALRMEIAELRAALVPIPTLILTGQQALDEFRRMTGLKS